MLAASVHRFSQRALIKLIQTLITDMMRSNYQVMIRLHALVQCLVACQLCSAANLAMFTYLTVKACCS